MALTTTVVDAAVDAATALLAYASLHTADPGATGANEVSGGGYARQLVSWDLASGGVSSTLGTLTFSGPASSAATHVGLWSAASGGTWYGGAELSGDQAFNSGGEYEVTSITLTGSAS